MHTKILAAVLCFSATAFADPPIHNNLDSAIASEHESSNRVRFYARATTIAERDIVSATIKRDLARERWDAAIRADRSRAAGRWAIRYHDASRAEAKAQERAARFRVARDVARADFRAAAAQTRQLTRQARARGVRTRR